MPDEGISIVMPAYNAGDTIRASIQSVLDQTYQKFELIIIDDGSTDATADIVRDFCDAVRFVTQENGGPAVARNHGIELCQYDWVTFLDSDDLWQPHKLERQLQRAQETTAAIVYTNVRNFGAGDRVGEFRNLPPMPQGDVFVDLLRDNFVTLSTVMIRRDVLLDVGGFRPEMTGTEDWDLWLRLAEQGQEFAAISEPLVDYRWLDDSFSRNNDLMTTMRTRTVRQMLQTDRGRRLSWAIRREIQANAAATSAWFTSEASPVLSARLYLRAITTSPWRFCHWKDLARQLLRTVGLRRAA